MSHYFSKEQETPFTVTKFHTVLRGKEYSFFTAPGVFSKDKVDFGTRILAEYMHIGKHDTVLDLGCGIGILGRVAAEQTDEQVVLVDVNPRAVKLARMNTKQLSNTEVMESDAYQALHGMEFDVILLNPPQTAGKKLCFALIADAKHHLKHHGKLEVVARHNKGGETLSKHMQDVFGNMETIARKGGYRVYVSKLE